MKTLVSKLVGPAYLAGVVFAAYTGISTYVTASSIMRDHTVIEAPMELVDMSSRTKRGHTSVTYHFSYSYVVAGNEYSSAYSAVNEHGERFLDAQSITLAYSNTNPADSGALHLLERQSSLWEMIKGFLLFSTILGVLALFVYGWSVAGKEDNDEDGGVGVSAAPEARS